MSDIKRLSRVEIKDVDRGEFAAVFATLGVVDSDGDVTLSGAFEDGAKVAVSAWGHQSWMGKLPVGVATIRETSSEAVAAGQFFMDVPEAAATFATVKRLHEAGLGQWSYGYDPVGAYPGEFGGRRVRFLPRQVVHEVSPLLQGAGVNTRTLSAKGANPGSTEGQAVVSYKAAIRSHDTDVVSRAWDAGAVESAIPDGASVSDLRAVYAWVDSQGDPETKSSYKFPHHHGPGGPANVRACVAGVAALNGARGGTSIPAGDRQGVWSHLAGHLRDADREPPELRSADPGNMKLDLRDEVAAALAGVSAAVDSASRVVALRAARGKSLSRVNVEYLGWLDEDLLTLHRKLRSYIDSPDDEVAREFMRFVALQHGHQGEHR